MDLMAGVLRLAFLAVISLFFLNVLLTLSRNVKTGEKISVKKGKSGILTVLEGGNLLEEEDCDKIIIPDSCSIGRNSDNSIVILDPFASNFHAIIRKRGDSYYLADLESKNGTVLNGNMLENDTLLKKNDVIRIGDVVFRFGLE